MTIKVAPAAPLDRFTKDDHSGHLILFVNSRIEVGDYGFGEAESAVCDVICVNCCKAWEDQRIFGTMIVPRLGLTTDKVVAGLLVQGEAKAGRSAPWLLDDPDENELADVQAVADRVISQLGSGKIVVDFDAINNLEAF
jgi:hypothetical protein